MGFIKQISRKEIEAQKRKAQVELAGRRGTHYLEYAKKALASGDIAGAREYAKEGVTITSRCWYYVAVREQLQDFLKTLPA